MTYAASVSLKEDIGMQAGVRSSVDKFCSWLRTSGTKSYDPYDVLGTSYGRWARKLYYAHHPLGTILSAPLILMEIGFPGLRKLLVKRDEYPTANAQLALAFLNLYEIDKESGTEDEWLNQAKDLAVRLLTQSIRGYKGHCWGYPFDWQNVNGLMPRGTPHITATPYCYEVFARLYDITGESGYLEVARSITRFVLEDLKDSEAGLGATASSYTPHDNGKVVNASAYRAFLLFDAASRFQNENCYETAWKNLRFILQSQREDGSWLYAIDNAPEAFIDHFHTCFVLKNLQKMNLRLHNDDVQRSIRNGYKYYRQNLFDADDNPMLFAIAPRAQLVRLEMYNFAEAITLGTLLRDEIPEAFLLAKNLAAHLISRYQLPQGYWMTRVYRGGIRHTLPFLRWPQAQLFLALTNLLLVGGEQDS